MSQSLLSWLIWLPITGAVLILLAGERRGSLPGLVALAATSVTLILSLVALGDFDTTTAAMQFVERSSWIPGLDVEYYLGVDGISLPLIVLTAFVSLLIVVAGWGGITKRPGQYLASFLLLEGLMIGVFLALDSILFYVFFEAMLIPMFIIIGIWGGPGRIYATLKFFLYTFLGSIFMLVALIYLYLQGGSFDVLALHQLPLSLSEQVWIFLAFFAAFAVKIPMWPVHTWLPDAHVEAPTGGSVILAAIMLKIGGYGFLRFALPIAPDASALLDELVISFSLIAVIYVGFVALGQKDMKKLIAYSSISHMGFVTLGIFIVFALVRDSEAQAAVMGFSGAMVQMISHGFISAALFLCIGVLYDRMHSREISDYGGVANVMPWFAAFMVLFAMANSGLPGTSGFVGEFLVVLASFQANAWIAVLAALTLLLGAAYSLWLVKRVVFGEVRNEQVAALPDLLPREAIALTALAVVTLWLGIWPSPLIELMQPSLADLVDHVNLTKVTPLLNAGVAP